VPPALTDLEKLAKHLNDAGYPGSAIHFQGAAGIVKCREEDLIQTQARLDAERDASSDQAKLAG
jgi:hypothetical protein